MRKLLLSMTGASSLILLSNKTNLNAAPVPDIENVASRQSAGVELPPELRAEIFGHVNDPFDL
ncbi:hypothetical protein HBI56_130100 [Parastagonospora nodorum]|nr:hypothetical protein HBI09_133830 [Parastagonospora nodorum]KAH4086476.1 hypothetical protein HBH46_204070 [Parastagonospora nodorum]KAH4404730.1 hypothetical protein HBH92_187390 [Parastagonospora nodorum]KAH4423508.1 hypothetical protein HBH93_194930 [Parastagonospora nodorum]KAH4465977.1 hypothetical protein HBH91_036130 [Parastagonospora nodorum]